MDYRMPLKNGIEATMEIMENETHSIFIFASADSSIREELYSMGIEYFIEKPFDIEILVEIINKALNIKGDFNLNMIN